jgi:hypothetical protein
MLPHPATSGKIAERRLQERLRDTAQQRRAASAETGARSRPTNATPAWRTVISGITGVWLRVRGATRVLATDPRERGSAKPAHPVA